MKRIYKTIAIAAALIVTLPFAIIMLMLMRGVIIEMFLWATGTK